MALNEVGRLPRSLPWIVGSSDRRIVGSSDRRIVGFILERLGADHNTVLVDEHVRTRNHSDLILNLEAERTLDMCRPLVIHKA